MARLTRTPGGRPTDAGPADEGPAGEGPADEGSADGRLGALRGWVLTLAALALAPCASADSVSVTDRRGVTVTLDRPAERIVALAPHAAELLYAAGAGERVVAAVAHSDYPPAAGKLPRVGDAFRIDFERIVALEPDLVVAWASGNPRRAIERLEALDIPVFVTELRSLSAVPRTLVELGRLAGSRATAERAARSFRRGRAALERRYSGRRSLSVFFQVGREPVYTVNGEHWISEVIRLCGGRNIFAELDTLAPSVGVEAVLARRPQAIVVALGDGAEPALAHWRSLADLPATRLGNLFAMNPDRLNRPTPRLLDGARALCATLERARKRLRGADSGDDTEAE